MNSNYRANGGNPSGNGLLNGENSTGGPYTGGNGGSGGSVDQLGDEFYAGSDGSDAPGITDNNGVYHQPGTKYGGGKGQGYTTRDFGEPTGKRNAGGGGADRNRDNGNGGESDYDAVLVKVLEKVEDMAEEVAAPMELEEMEQC